MTHERRSLGRRLAWSGAVAALAVACGDSGGTGGQVTPSAVPSTRASAAPIASGSTTPASTAPSSSPSPSASASAAPKDEALPKPRALRAGEQAEVERAFPATARFDFAQSFVVEMGTGLGTCSFVSELVEGTAPAAGSASATPEASASAAPAVGASAAPSSGASASDLPRPPPVDAFRFHLVCKGREAIALPPHPGVESGWTGHGVKAVTFPDTDDDGLREIVVIAEMMTGMGPDGAKPFPVVYVYRFAGGTFALDEAVSKKATADGASTLADVLERMKP